MNDDSVHTDGVQPITVVGLCEWITETLPDLEKAGNVPLGPPPANLPKAGADATGKTHSKISFCSDPNRNRLEYLCDAIQNLPNFDLSTAVRLVKRSRQVQTVPELRLFMKRCQNALLKTIAATSGANVSEKRLTWFAFPFEIRSAWMEPGEPGYFLDKVNKVYIYRLSDVEIQMLDREYPGYKPTKPPWELLEERVITRRASLSNQPIEQIYAGDVLKLVGDFFTETSFDPTIPCPKTTLAVDRFATIVKYRFRQITHAAQNDAYWPKHLGGGDSRVVSVQKSWSEDGIESMQSLKKQAIEEAVKAGLDKEICPIIRRLADSLAERERVADTVAKWNRLPEELRPGFTKNDHLRWKVIEPVLLELESHFDWLEAVLKEKQGHAKVQMSRAGDVYVEAPNAGGQRPSTPKRGRRKGAVASDVKHDQRIYEAWAGGKGSYRNFEEVAKEFGITTEEARLAKERHRDRLRGKSGKNAVKKTRQEK